MDINHVPQDDISTYAKNKKAIYATDHNGDYRVIASSGWNVEGEATLQALDEFKSQTHGAYKAVVDGIKSPLLYHMYSQRMDVAVLAQSVGTFKWCIKRHFKPKTFNKISDKWLIRYADALGLDVDVIKTLPKVE